MSFFGPIKKVHNHNPPRISIYDNKTNKSVNPWKFSSRSLDLVVSFA